MLSDVTWLLCRLSEIPQMLSAALSTLNSYLLHTTDDTLCHRTHLFFSIYVGIKSTLVWYVLSTNSVFDRILLFHM